MTEQDFTDGRKLASMGYTFSGLVQAAMRRALDNGNYIELDKLHVAFPVIYSELYDGLLRTPINTWHEPQPETD